MCPFIINKETSFAKNDLFKSHVLLYLYSDDIYLSDVIDI